METRSKSNNKENCGAIPRNNSTTNRKLTSRSDKTVQLKNDGTYQKPNNRKPLGDLDTNIKVPTKRDQQTQLTQINTLQILEETEVPCSLPINISKNTQAPKFRSKSQSTAIKDKKPSGIGERKNIIVRRRLSSTSNVNLSKPLADSCTTFIPQKISTSVKRKASQLSPIRPNVYTSRSTLLLQKIPDETTRPAKKKTLEHEHLSLDLYNTEYLKDIIRHQLNNNWKYVARKNFLKYDSDENNRAIIINWLMQVVDYLQQPIYVLFMSVRLMDDILGSSSVPKNMYQLLGIVLMWILSKLDDNINAISMSEMLLLIDRAYTKRQFLKLERKLLKYFNFKLIMPDVTIFVTFYLKKLHFEKNEKILNCVHYILECYLLSSEFSTITYSKQAAAAVCLTLNILYPNEHLWLELKHSVAYHSPVELEELMQNMLEQIHIIQDPKHMHRQPYIKYSNPQKFQASIILLRKLVAT